jgi:3-dehydroquinate synthetase
MVDSSVGGKTGINCEFGKNLIGAFYQPKLVMINLDVINSLPEREILAGYAEIVKYGLINDEEFFDYLISKESDEIIDNLQYMVEKSCISKANIVSADEKEKGQRALLNLGHTFGHALEAIANYDGSLLHGEAVAIGMILAYRFSEFLGFCPEGRANKIESHFIKKGMKTKISQLKKQVSADQMIDLMKGDKKVSGGKMVFIMAKDIGKCYIDRDIDEASLKSFLEDEINR